MQRFLLSFAVSVALATTAMPAYAQSAHAKASASAEVQRYPNATRKSPEPKVGKTTVKALQAIAELYGKQSYADASTQAVAFGNGGTGTPYETAYAWQVAGSAAAALKDNAHAAEYFQKAIDANGLDNNSHYDTMSNLIATQQAAGQPAAALKTLDRFLAETKATDPTYISMRASLLAALGRNDEAAKAYSAAAAAHPNDRSALMNTVASYQATKDYAKADALLQDARKRGALTEASDYQALYSGLLVNEKKWRDAVAVLDEGVAKGVLPKNDDTAKAYMVAGQEAFAENQWNLALESYTKAAAMSSTGEADLNRARILHTQGKSAESRAAAKAALAKGGVKNMADAQRLAK